MGFTGVSVSNFFYVGNIRNYSMVSFKSESESELLLVTRSNDNHSPGPVMREVSP